MKDHVEIGHLTKYDASPLTAGFFYKGHQDERLVLANIHWPCRDEGKTGGMAEWGVFFFSYMPRPCLVPFSFRLKSLSS